MNYDLILTFCDPITKDNEYEIPYTLAPHGTAYKWLRLLYQDIYVRNCTWNNNRYVGFDGTTAEKQKLKDEMLEMIAICKRERPKEFDIEIKNNIDQDEFNRLHTWFEVYRGALDDPHPYFITGSPEFQQAIERFNQLIHMWEVQDEFARKNITAVNIDFNHHSRIPMEDDDYRNFEFMSYSDSIVMPFVSRGKTLIDFWRDNDDHVGDENIRQHSNIGSNFKLRCSGGWTEEHRKEKWAEFSDWFRRKENYLNSIGFYWDDLRCCKGYITLGYSTIPNTRDIIAPRQFLKSIRIFE